MRIAFVALHFSEYAWNLVRALARDNEVLAILNRTNYEAELGKDVSDPLPANCSVVFVDHKKTVSGIAANAVGLVKTVNRFRPEVIHFQEDCKDSFMLALPFIRRAPFVLTIHDPFPHSGADTRLRTWGRFRLYSWILRRIADKAIVHGQMLKDETERLLPRLKGRVAAVPHGPLGPWNIPPRFDWEPGNLLFFGRIEAYKGLSLFIEAVRALASAGISVRGVVAGRGEDLQKHRQTLLNDTLFELHEGFIERAMVDKLFRKANVVVLPYTDGTQSGVAALAIGYGRAVVASRVGGIPDLVKDGETGVLVAPGNVHELVGALRGLIEDEETTRAYAKNACGLATGELSWLRLALMHEAVYRSAIFTDTGR